MSKVSFKTYVDYATTDLRELLKIPSRYKSINKTTKAGIPADNT